jgi:hypothetical protein
MNILNNPYLQGEKCIFGAVKMGLETVYRSIKI